MRFILDNKIYDAEKSEKVLDYIIRLPNGLFSQMYRNYNAALYKTKEVTGLEL